MTDLRDKALLALDEAYEEAQSGAVPKSAHLRFVLAFLANFAQDRGGFDLFWKTATEPASSDNLSDQFGRRQSLRNARAVIYRAMGIEPPD